MERACDEAPPAKRHTPDAAAQSAATAADESSSIQDLVLEVAMKVHKHELLALLRTSATSLPEHLAFVSKHVAWEPAGVRGRLMAHAMIRSGSNERLRLLLSALQNPQDMAARLAQRDGDGFTALLHAVDAGKVDVVALLLGVGSNPNEAVQRPEPLVQEAGARGNEGAAAWLLALRRQDNVAVACALLDSPRLDVRTESQGWCVLAAALMHHRNLGDSPQDAAMRLARLAAAGALPPLHGCSSSAELQWDYRTFLTLPEIAILARAPPEVLRAAVAAHARPLSPDDVDVMFARMLEREGMTDWDEWQQTRELASMSVGRRDVAWPAADAEVLGEAALPWAQRSAGARVKDWVLAAHLAAARDDAAALCVLLDRLEPAGLVQALVETPLRLSSAGYLALQEVCQPAGMQVSFTEEVTLVHRATQADALQCLALLRDTAQRLGLPLDAWAVAEARDRVRYDRLVPLAAVRSVAAAQELLSWASTPQLAQAMQTLCERPWRQENPYIQAAVRGLPGVMALLLPLMPDTCDAECVVVHAAHVAANQEAAFSATLHAMRLMKGRSVQYMVNAFLANLVPRRVVPLLHKALLDGSLELLEGYLQALQASPDLLYAMLHTYDLDGKMPLHVAEERLPSIFSACLLAAGATKDVPCDVPRAIDEPIEPPHPDCSLHNSVFCWRLRWFGAMLDVEAVLGLAAPRAQACHTGT